MASTTAARRTPRQKRLLRLWTAAWLAVLLLAGLLVAGDVRVQWPVFAVPLLWALVAARPRRGGYGSWADAGPAGEPKDAPGFWDDPPGTERPSRRWEGGPVAPPTRETGVLPPLPPRREEPSGDDRRRG